jgi:transposase
MSLEERLMGRKKYSQQFKEEAVRQVVDRGHSVKDVASRLGVSEHSLYKWTRAERPSRQEKRTLDLDEANREIAKLKKELRRTAEERDILKKAAAYFAKEPE